MNDDQLAMTITGLVLAAFVGPGIAAKMIPAVRDALLQWHILVDEGVLVPLVEGVGLDLGRILILAAVLALLIALVITTKRRVAAHREAARS